MILPAAHMPSFAEDATILHHDGANRRIRARMSTAPGGQRQRTHHEARFVNRR
jgi:hypothetical protein